MSSAYSITRAVRPPRAVFLDFPLGHTAGKAGDAKLNRRILEDTLRAFETIVTPGSMIALPYKWADDDAWKETVMRSPSGEPRDERRARVETPQYQRCSDSEAADEAAPCASCIWLEPR
jgi:hypothetical protein